MEPIFATLIVFGSITFVIIKLAQYSHDFKTKLIEKGLSVEESKALFAKPKQFLSINPLRNLQIGVLSLFAGLGIFVGQAFDRMYDYETFIPTSILISCGIGLILFYFISKKKIGSDN